MKLLAELTKCGHILLGGGGALDELGGTDESALGVGIHLILDDPKVRTLGETFFDETHFIFLSGK